MSAFHRRRKPIKYFTKITDNALHSAYQTCNCKHFFKSSFLIFLNKPTQNVHYGSEKNGYTRYILKPSINLDATKPTFNL